MTTIATCGHEIPNDKPVSDYAITVKSYSESVNTYGKKTLSHIVVCDKCRKEYEGIIVTSEKEENDWMNPYPKRGEITRFEVKNPDIKITSDYTELKRENAYLKKTCRRT